MRLPHHLDGPAAACCLRCFCWYSLSRRLPLTAHAAESSVHTAPHSCPSTRLPPSEPPVPSANSPVRCDTTLLMLPYYIVKAMLLLALGRHPAQKDR